MNEFVEFSWWQGKINMYEIIKQTLMAVLHNATLAYKNSKTPDQKKKWKLECQKIKKQILKSS